jgi:hypothetical protein
MGFQDQPIQDQMMVLYSQNAILGREFSKQNAILGLKFSELRASVENNAATTLQSHSVLNRNINRIAMMPARRIAGPIAAGQHAAPAGPGNNPQPTGPANVLVVGGAGTLSPHPQGNTL